MQINLDEIMQWLEVHGDPQTKKTHLKHGAKEPLFGVKIGELKFWVSKLKKQYELALDLYNTGNSDAMYLAGLIADEQKMRQEDLQKWVEQAYWYFLSEYAVPWVCAESKHGIQLGLEWIHSDQDQISSAGWACLSNTIALYTADRLPIDRYKLLLEEIPTSIQKAQNRTRYTMNGFLIAAGSYEAALHPLAIEIANGLGPVLVDMGGTACKVPLATTAIQKSVERGTLVKKKKSVRC